VFSSDFRDHIRARGRNERASNNFHNRNHGYKCQTLMFSNHTPDRAEKICQEQGMHNFNDITSGFPPWKRDDRCRPGLASN
jgi:hypothetical protein